MLGLSVNSVILVEGTLFFIFSFHPCSFSTISFSTSVSYLLLLPHLLFQFLVPFPLINSSVLSYSFLDFTFSSSLFILFFSLYLLLIPIGFLHFFSLFFILTLLFLSLYFSFLRGFCNFLHIPSPWWTTNSVDKLS